MRLLFLLCCLTGFVAQAQDLTGIWRGHFRSGTNRMFELPGEEDRYKFEIQLDQRNKQFKGVTYSYKTTVFYGKAVCNGTVNPATGKVLLEELKIVEVKMAGGDACIMTCFMQYSKAGNEEFLEGYYTSMNTRDSSNCGKGTVFLRRVAVSDFYKEPFLVQREKENEARNKKETIVEVPKKNNPPVVKKAPPPPPKPVAPKEEKVTNNPPAPEDPKKEITEANIEKNNSRPAIKKPVIPPPKAITGRSNELVRTIMIDKGKVLVSLYDNGTIDNDTVSVYLNNKLVVSKQRLTEKPIVVSFDAGDDEEEYELVMVAENLGEIPPNTSLMVVKAGSQQYEVRITSNEQKNAVVRFQVNQQP